MRRTPRFGWLEHQGLATSRRRGEKRLLLRSADFLFASNLLMENTVIENSNEKNFYIFNILSLSYKYALVNQFIIGYNIVTTTTRATFPEIERTTFCRQKPEIQIIVQYGTEMQLQGGAGSPGRLTGHCRVTIVKQSYKKGLQGGCHEAFCL
jgi:hypothetical protein